LKNVEVLDAKRRVQTSENISRTDLPVLSKKLVNERNLKV